MKRTARTILGLAGVVAVAWAWPACSASDNSTAHSAAGAPGAGGTTSAGGASGTAGTAGVGGDTATGGAAGTGGSAGAGGATAAGGAAGAGGDTAAGAGGTTSAGGSAGAGGATAAGGAAGAGGDTAAGGAAGAGGATSPGCSPVAATIPFTVTTKYGCGANNGVWGNNMGAKITDCAARAPGTPAGTCKTIAYTYDATKGSDCTGAPIGDAGAISCDWTAVVWHVAAPGLCIGPGATKVTFQAWGTGTVEFQAVGVKLLQPLTATATPYTIDISTSGYAAAPQESGFIVAFTSANTGASVSVDDIKWVP
jgi:hypothetical protein